jgi:hypothetical protein
MKPTVYIETSIIGYLASFPSRDLVTAANQQLTAEWWRNDKHKFELFVSAVVVQEASGGNPTDAEKRMQLIRPLPILGLRHDVVVLSKDLLKKHLLPLKAQTDALHISLVAIHGMDYLLTWNCKNIANATMRPKIEAFINSTGLICPSICTVHEL